MSANSYPFYRRFSVGSVRKVYEAVMAVTAGMIVAPNAYNIGADGQIKSNHLMDSAVVACEGTLSDSPQDVPELSGPCQYFDQLYLTDHPYASLDEPIRWDDAPTQNLQPGETTVTGTIYHLLPKQEFHDKFYIPDSADALLRKRWEKNAIGLGFLTIAGVGAGLELTVGQRRRRFIRMIRGVEGWLVEEANKWPPTAQESS